MGLFKNLFGKDETEKPKEELKEQPPKQTIFDLLKIDLTKVPDEKTI